MSLKGTFGPLVDRLREPNGKIALRWRWSGIAILALFCVVAIIGGAFWSIIALIGLVAAIVGIYAAVTGSAKSFRVRSRSAGAVMLGAGLLVMLVGTGVNAVTRPQTPDSASVAKSASSSVQVDEVVKPSPTPTPVKTESEVQLVAAIPLRSLRLKIPTSMWVLRPSQLRVLTVRQPQPISSNPSTAWKYPERSDVKRSRCSRYLK